MTQPPQNDHPATDKAQDEVPYIDPQYCDHNNQVSTFNSEYVEGRELNTFPRDIGWKKVGVVICRNCGTSWVVFQAPGLFD